MMKKYQKKILTLLLLFVASNILAQSTASYKFDKITANDFAIKSTLIDSNTSAVTIADVGSTDFEGNDQGWFNYIFKRKTRIKIINKKAFDLATVKVLLYQDSDDKEKINDLIAATYTLVNGQVTATKIDKKQVFEEKQDKNFTKIKFALPSVTEGCIIEYSYTIKSSFIFHIPSWEFQNPQHPTLWSEYNIANPSLLSYMSIFQNKHPFYIDKTEEAQKNYTVTVKRGIGLSSLDEKLNVSASVNKHRWVIKNVPGFKEEDFITTPLNYIDKIEFQLHQTYDGEETHNVYNTWKAATEKMLKREDFGVALDESETWCKELLKTVVDVNTDPLQQIKDVYYYVQKNFACTNHYRMFVKTSLHDVIKKHSGTVGEINLLLTGLLRQLNIPAFPVILSSREEGRTYPQYPDMNQYNYVICKITYNNADFYLDASQPLLGFAKLPLSCYNGFAKVISKDSADVILDANNLKEYKATSVFIINDSLLGYTGSVTKNYGYYESLQTRETIAKSSQEDFKTKLESDVSSENIKAKNAVIDSLENLESPISVKYDLDINLKGGEDIIYFNPMFDETIRQNPFKEAEREYPVEMSYTVDEIYNLNMEVPKGYKLDELPKSVKLKLDGNDGTFEYIVAADANLIQMRCTLKISKANFSSDSYQTLRDFYAYVVKKESEQIVFKKIKK